MRQDLEVAVAGSDGIHNAVNSTVRVKVSNMNNGTLDATTVIRLSGVSAASFLEKRYNSLINSLESKLPSGSSARVLAVQETGDYLDLFLTSRNSDLTYSPVSSTILREKSAIESQANIKIADPDLDVCAGETCSGNGVCESRVRAYEQLDFRTSASLILTSSSLRLEPVCDCVDEFIGRDCSEPAAACISSPCLNRGVCVPIGESQFDCMCTDQWTGGRCDTDVNECSGPLQPCLNGGR